jgi:GDPmannose 4,6-dehydratase
VAKIKLGKVDELRLGTLEPKRDWGYAGDYVEAMHLMVQQAIPDDYVIATGLSYSVRDFLNIAFNHIEINDWNSYVKINPLFLRPAEVDVLRGDYSKAKEKLGWSPKTDFKEMVIKMVDEDIKKLKK